MWINNDFKNFDSGLYQLYALVMQVVKGKSIFYYNPSGLECNWQWFQQHNLTNQPQWVWHSQTAYSSLREHHNSELFVFACLSDSFNMNELMALPTILRHLRSVRVLIELGNSSNNNGVLISKMDTLATHILSFCRQSSMLNVALYFQHATHPLTLYSFKAFPHFRLLKRLFTSSALTREDELYPNQIEHFGGYALRVMLDLSEPNSIMYRDAQGNSRITGFMWHFIESFAETLRAGLNVSYPTWKRGSRKTSEYHMLEFTRNGSVDFGLIPVLMTEKLSNRYCQYSFPVIHGNWCIMLPQERRIDIQALFKCVLEIKALALLLVVFGCVGLSSWIGVAHFPIWIRYCWDRLSTFPKLLTLLVLCACEAQFLTLLISRPLATPINNFDSLLESDLRIFSFRPDFDMLENSFRARYAAAFRLTDNVSELYQLRNSFNTSWAYTIPMAKWHIIDAQQHYFQKPLFRYSDLCPFGNFPQSILVSEESIYREALNLFTMKARQSGLIFHWLKHGFNDMVTAGLMYLKDYSQIEQWRILRLQDLQFAWHWFGAGLLLALIVFVVELLRFYVKVWLDNL